MRFLDNPQSALGGNKVVALGSEVGGHFVTTAQCDALADDIAQHMKELEVWMKAYQKCVDEGCTSEQLAAISKGYWADVASIEDAVRQYWLRCSYRTTFPY